MEEQTMGYEEALRRIEEARATGATELDLSELELTELPQKIAQLRDLTELDLSFNRLSSLPPELFHMTNLRKLILFETRLTSLPPEIAQLTNLTELNIGMRWLSDLPPELFQMTNLSKLNLSGNRLSLLLPQIFQLTNLTELNLSRNQLTSLPSQIVQLTNLTVLDLGGNRLSSLPSELYQLTHLTELYLWSNPLTSISPQLVQLTNLSKLDLWDTPLVSPPYKLATQGVDAIREYFKGRKEGGLPLNEIRIIVMGEESTGKTSFLRCLRGKKNNPHEAPTKGICIRNWNMKSHDQGLRCNLWDFSGKDIMYATHQLFLSSRSLYVLVLDGRKDEQPECWLNFIDIFRGSSPVLVVLNKYDINPDFELNQRSLQKNYRFIRGFFRISSVTGEGIDAFRKTLKKELNRVPIFRSEWPLNWFRAKTQLEQMNKPRISYETFKVVCRQAGVKGEKSQKVLGEFLHDLGIIIYFNLDDNHAFNPKWMIEAVYRIINTETVVAGRGILKLDQLKEIFRWQEGDVYRYYQDDFLYLVDLMRKLELCYDLDSEHVLFPQMLDAFQPAFNFPYQASLRCILYYVNFLPPSVMPRFIVKRHKEIKGDLCWRTGVVLEHPSQEATAVVRAEPGRIHIAIVGRKRKVYKFIIMSTLKDINSSMNLLTDVRPDLSN